MNREAIMNKYVAFLDILGFKNKLKEFSQENAKNYIKAFSTTIYKIFQYNNQLNSRKINGFIVSDSVILYTSNVSNKILNELIHIVEEICREEFSQNGIIMRGAIAKGEFDNIPAVELPKLQKQLIVGSAYVEAYLLESAVKTIGINLSKVVYEDLINCDLSINIIEERIDGEIYYVFQYMTLDFLMNKTNMQRFIALAKESKWLPHYYNTVYFAMKSQNNNKKIKQVFINIQNLVCDNKPKENWRDLDLFIKNTFAEGVIDEYKTRFLKYIRQKL